MTTAMLRRIGKLEHMIGVSARCSGCAGLHFPLQAVVIPAIIRGDESVCTCVACGCAAELAATLRDAYPAGTTEER
jgi:hypothetical protein